MMRRLLVLLLGLTAQALVLCAQDKQNYFYAPVGDVFASDPVLTTGNYYMYDFDTPAPTAPPKGYKACHISMYARHGARPYGRQTFYETLDKVFAEAARQDLFTEQGKDFYKRLQRVLVLTDSQAGTLTARGMEQHRMLAKQMYRNYPEVFKGRPNVGARSTTVPRCILSMSSFLQGLLSCSPKLQISQSASNADMPVLNPSCSLNVKVVMGYDDEKTIESPDAPWKSLYVDFWSKNCHPETFFEKIVKDVGALGAIAGDLVELQRKMFYLIADNQCVTDEFDFYDIATVDEMAAMWECENFRFYSIAGNSPWYNGHNWAYAEILARDILDCAKVDLEQGDVSARLRFGHDFKLINLLALLDVDGWNEMTPDRDEVKNIFRFYNAPMAMNLQFVFYRNRKGDVLVRPVLNGHDMALKVEGEAGPFYTWDGFEAFVSSRVALAQSILDSYGK